MKCEKCGSETSALVRFCPNCGGKIAELQQKKPNEVTTEWLRTLMSRLGYTPAPNVEDSSDSVFGIHDNRYNLTLSILNNPRAITFRSGFNMKKPKVINEFLLALNKANLGSVTTTYFVSDTFDGLWVYSFLILTSQIDDLDVMKMIERFDEEIRHTIKSAGLLALME